MTTALFDGACLDTGATRTITGLQQAVALRKALGLRLRALPSKLRVRFGSGPTASRGRISIPVIIGNSSVYVPADDVPNDVPFLVGLDTFDRLRLTPDVVDNVLIHKPSGRRFQCIRKRGHLYFVWPISPHPALSSHQPQASTSFYTTAELTRLHRHFYHPPARRLYDLLRRANPRDSSPETLRTLEQLAAACSVCQTFGARPYRFRVSFPASPIRFNEEVSLDLFWLDGKPALHVADMQTGFGNAVFLRGQRVEDVWDAFVECWTTHYVGHPSMMRIDQGTQFTYIRWEARANAAGIILRTTGVESHNSLGLGERYHSPLRQIYLKIRTSEPTISPALALRLAVKTMNDTIGPNGLVHTLLVFGTLPRLPTGTSPFPDQDARHRALSTARREYETIVSHRRIREALNSRVPPAADRIIVPGDRVRVFLETNGRLSIPHKVLSVIDKQIWLDVDGRRVQHNISQVVPVTPPPADHLVALLHTVLDGSMQPDPAAQEPLILLTETLSPGDPRCRSSFFRAAIDNEIAGLNARQTWTVVPDSSPPPNANILGSRFVLAIKDFDSPHPR